MSIIVKPINLFDNSLTYDQTKTSWLGKITTKTLAGKQVVGTPIVKYRNTITGPEAITPTEVFITENNRIIVATAETNGLIQIALYNLLVANGDVEYVGKIVIQVPEPPSTTYVIRGLRMIDAGTTNWKIFLLTTANVAAHNGLYMVNNLDLADFTFVPPTFPTATAPGQKAVYKLDDSPFTLNNGAGLILDIANTRLYVHRGVAASHSFLVYNYNATITTVGALGATTDLYLFSTGNLPALSGALLLTNSEDYVVPASGPNAGEPCVVFHTANFMYRGRISELTNGATLWPSLEFANNGAALNQFVPQTTLRAAYSNVLDRVILLCSSSAAPATVIVKRFENDQQDLICTILAAENNEAVARDLHKFKSPIAPIGFDARQGYLAMISGTTGARGLYTAAFDVDDVFDLTSIISPVLDVQGDQIFRFTAGFVRPEFASPVKICYRTSGFGSATGGWIDVADDLDFGGIISATGQIQIKITFKVFINDSTNGLQIYSAGLVTRSINATSDFWEYSHEQSNPGLPSIVAYRLKKAYPSAVPNLFFRATDTSNNLYVQSTTALNPGLFEFSTNGGLTWTSLGTIPNTVGTLVRYTFAVPPGIDVRPSIRED